MFKIEVRIYISYAANFSALLEIQNLGGKRWIHQTQHVSLTHFKGPTLKTIEGIDFSPFFPFEDLIMANELKSIKRLMNNIEY